MFFFEEINNLKFEFDLIIYSYVIFCFVDFDDIKEVCLWYNKIKEMDWVFFVVVYFFLVKGFCKIGEIDVVILFV